MSYRFIVQKPDALYITAPSPILHTTWRFGAASFAGGRPRTLKQLFLLNITARTTVRRKLTRLIEQGIVMRRKHKSDQRSTLLTLSSSSTKLLGKYGGALTAFSASISD